MRERLAHPELPMVNSLHLSLGRQQRSSTMQKHPSPAVSFNQISKQVVLTCLVLIVVGAIFWLPSAGAVTFGSTTLAGKGVGTGSWSVSNSNGTQFKITGKTRDLRTGGNTIYWRAQTQKSSGTCYAASSDYVSGSCSQDFYNHKAVNGGEYNTGKWRWSTRYSPLDTHSQGHRANLQVCENRRALPDPCSVSAISPSSFWLG